MTNSTHAIVFMAIKSMAQSVGGCGFLQLSARLKCVSGLNTVILAKAIKRFRVAKGITQVELGIRSGFDPKTISRYETGEYVPTIEAVYKFAEILGVPVKEFFTDFESEIEQRAFLFEVIRNADAEELKRLVDLIGKARKAPKI